MDKKVLKNQLIKVIAVLLSVSICIPSFDIFRMQEDVHAAEIHTLQNPVIETDSSMIAGQKVTWDCIWFGSYPQAEVLTTTMEEPIDSKIQNGNDFIKDDALYQKLQNATAWDANGDTTIDGEKYRRIQKSDATFAIAGDEEFYDFYDWSKEGYHYFKYQPIKWQVLETKDGKAFLLSNVSLDDKRYHEKSEAVTWATSTIRSWLNGYSGSYNQLSIDYSSKNFIGTAFSTEEQQLIQSTNVKNDDNIEYGAEGGEDTNDKIFLLSQSEVYTDNAKKYGFSSNKRNADEGRRKKSSTFSKALGTYSSTSGNDQGNCWWWLRSPGDHAVFAAYVNDYGWANANSSNVDNNNYGMCPALNLNLSSTNLYQYAGTVCSDGTVNEVAPVQTAEQETTTANEQTTITTSQLTTTDGNYTTKPQVTEYTPTTTQRETTTNSPTTTQKATTTNSPTTTQKATTTNSPTTTQKTTSSEENQTTTADRSVQSVQMDIESIAAFKGDTFSLTCQITPANALINTVTWNSSDSNVVVVDTQGNVMAVGKGTAIITVNIDGKTATTTVSVVEKENPTTTIPTSSLTQETTAPQQNTTDQFNTSIEITTSQKPTTINQTTEVTTTKEESTTEQQTKTEPNTTEMQTTSQTPVKPQPSTTVQSQNLPMATRPTNTYVSKKKQSISVKSTIVKTYSSKRFSLNARTNGNGKLSYKCSNKKVAKVLSNGTVIMKGYGKATITITASATSQYEKVSKKVTIVVHPAQGEITKIKLLGNGKIKVSWKKDKLGSGYVIQICKNKKFKKGYAQKYFEKNTSSVTIQLSRGTKYYYRIRAYKRTNGVDDYGKWSKAKSL